GRLARAASGQCVAQILRDVLQRPDVKVRRRILNGVLQIGCDVDAHAVWTTPWVSNCKAWPSAQPTVRNAPPSAWTTMPEYAHSGEARWRTAGMTCSGVSSSESSRVEVRVPVTTGEIALARMPCSAPSAATASIRPNAPMRDAPYAAKPETLSRGTIALLDVVNTRRPYPCRFMIGQAERVM